MALQFGVIAFGNILKYLFLAYPIQTKCIFIGLILGSIPALVKDVNSKTTFKPVYLIFTFFSLLFGILAVAFENNFPKFCQNEYSFMFLIISGILMSCGIIVPGVSSTLILMILGVYESYLNAISCVYLPFLFPFGIGVFIGSLFFMKVTKFLLDKFYAQTFFTIIGFTIGSIFVLFPRLFI